MLQWSCTWLTLHKDLIQILNEQSNKWKGCEMCCFIPACRWINLALEFLCSWQWTPVKSNCTVPGRRRSSTVWIRTKGRWVCTLHSGDVLWPSTEPAGGLSPHFVQSVPTVQGSQLPPSHLPFPTVVLYCSLWCPLAKQNRLECHGKANQVVLQRAVHIRILTWKSQAYILPSLLLSRQQCPQDPVCSGLPPLDDLQRTQRSTLSEHWPVVWLLGKSGVKVNTD